MMQSNIILYLLFTFTQRLEDKEMSDLKKSYRLNSPSVYQNLEKSIKSKEDDELQSTSPFQSSRSILRPSCRDTRVCPPCRPYPCPPYPCPPNPCQPYPCPPVPFCPTYPPIPPLPVPPLPPFPVYPPTPPLTPCPPYPGPPYPPCQVYPLCPPYPCSPLLKPRSAGHQNIDYYPRSNRPPYPGYPQPCLISYPCLPQQEHSRKKNWRPCPPRRRKRHFRVITDC